MDVDEPKPANGDAKHTAAAADDVVVPHGETGSGDVSEQEPPAKRARTEAGATESEQLQSIGQRPAGDGAGANPTETKELTGPGHDVTAAAPAAAPAAVSQEAAPLSVVQPAVDANAQPVSPIKTPTGGSLSKPTPSPGAQHQARRGDVVYRVLVPHRAVGIVIGKGGCNVREIQSSSGARVQVATAVPTCEEHVVVVSMPEEPDTEIHGAEKAVLALQKLLILEAEPTAAAALEALSQQQQQQQGLHQAEQKQQSSPGPGHDGPQEGATGSDHAAADGAPPAVAGHTSAGGSDPVAAAAEQPASAEAEPAQAAAVAPDVPPAGGTGEAAEPTAAQQLAAVGEPAAGTGAAEATTDASPVPGQQQQQAGPEAGVGSAADAAAQPTSSTPAAAAATSAPDGAADTAAQATTGDRPAGAHPTDTAVTEAGSTAAAAAASAGEPTAAAPASADDAAAAGTSTPMATTPKAGGSAQPGVSPSAAAAHRPPLSPAAAAAAAQPRLQHVSRVLLGHSQSLSLLAHGAVALKGIKEASGARLQVQFPEDSPLCALEGDRVAQLSGRAEQVMAGLQLLARHLRQHPPQEKPGGMHPALAARIAAARRPPPPPPPPRGYAQPGGYGAPPMGHYAAGGYGAPGYGY